MTSVKLAPSLFLSYFEIRALSASLAQRPEKTINYYNHFSLCKKFKTLHWLEFTAVSVVTGDLTTIAFCV